jgi:uncharacterized protein YbgA (DUF1722 family)
MLTLYDSDAQSDAARQLSLSLGSTKAKPMNSTANDFCNIIRKRSEENHKALSYFPEHSNVLSHAVSILRQELDSMIKVIYLLSIKNLSERNRLIQLTLKGKKWNRLHANNKYRTITDKDMVDLAQKLHGWTASVYRFGCAFIHLSNFHDHVSTNPFEKLPTEEKRDLLDHLRYYHGGPATDNPNIDELSQYIPRILEKITSNLECYLKELEEEKILESE